jgi:hypothetical protein
MLSNKEAVEKPIYTVTTELFDDFSIFAGISL